MPGSSHLRTGQNYTASAAKRGEPPLNRRIIRVFTAGAFSTVGGAPAPHDSGPPGCELCNPHPCDAAYHPKGLAFLPN